jgi:hypothetical protein
MIKDWIPGPTPEDDRRRAIIPVRPLVIPAQAGIQLKLYPNKKVDFLFVKIETDAHYFIINKLMMKI